MCAVKISCILSFAVPRVKMGSPRSPRDSAAARGQIGSGRLLFVLSVILSVGTVAACRRSLRSNLSFVFWGE